MIIKRKKTLITTGVTTHVNSYLDSFLLLARSDAHYCSGATFEIVLVVRRVETMASDASLFGVIAVVPMTALTLIIFETQRHSRNRSNECIVTFTKCSLVSSDNVF